uniref:Obscurin-like protein 1 n=1 Tax=Chrysemys picta bellii TaxID=8478 RepID=A0A8C3HX23_CHRPI
GKAGSGPMDVFGGAPRFLAYPRTFTVQSGADAVLKCQIAGDPRPSIIWEKDKSPIALLGRFQVEAEGSVYSLSISQVTPADSGQYVCKAKNAIGETYAAATLKVEAGELQQEGHPEDMPPVFLSKPLSWQVCRGEDVMFTCRISGQPSPVLQWEKDGRQLSDLFESSHFSVGMEPEDWHFLKIFSARPPDGGVYVCRARNRSGEALAAAVLLVNPMQPDQHGDRRHCHGQPKAFAVSEGKHAKFRCYVTGKPKPEIVWKKDGKVVAPDRRHLVYEDREGYFILKVLYCKARDQGLYICTASNTAGQTLSAVQLHVREHRVRFQLQLEDVEVQECEDAVLECKVPLETIPTAWYLEDKQLQPSHKYVIEEQGLVRRLTIRDARADDDGIYLCEMKDKGRSIAEVSVRGAIVKRLPRKLDVMEGENAAFCVETRDSVEGIRWSRNGLELRETPCTVLKSFGKTHLLVLVHVTREDAGVISFSVGESQTSAQLRIKCAKRVPPSAPVAAEMSTDRSNAALLTWCPGPDVHRTPPSSYVLERQEASTAEWVQCLTTDLASMVEVLGDSVPAEADYCFRICAVNKYGRSRPVEFPGSVHLVPVACVRRALKDVQVQAGQDALFSLELSASVAGSWFLNGAKLEEGEEGQRYCIKRSGTEHSLLLRGVRLAESGAKVKFESSGVRDSATLRVQEPPVRIVSSNEDAAHTYLASERVVLACELSRADGPVQWYKDGVEVEEGEHLLLEHEGPHHRLIIPSARPQDTGEFVCDAGGDSVFYNITVTEPPVRIVSSNEDAAHTYLALERVVLACELSRADGPVQWYKDGVEVEEGEHLLLEHEGPHHRLIIPSARPQDTGEFVCDAGGDSVFYNISISSWRIGPSILLARTGLPLLLECEVSTPDAPVRWLKDGEAVPSDDVVALQAEGCARRLFIRSARPSDSGTYTCDAGEDALSFTVTVTEPPVRIVRSNEDAAHTYLASERVVLACELSRADGPVQWYKDGVEVEEDEHLLLECEGPHHRLIIPSARPQDTGEFVCDAGGDSVFYNITVTEPPVRILRPQERSLELQALVLQRLELRCELSRAEAQVCWFKDGLEVDETENLLLRAEGAQRWLIVPQARAEDAGEYICETRDDLIFCVAVEDVALGPKSLPTPDLRCLAAGDDLVVACEVSRPSAAVRWLRDGQELVASERVRIEDRGALRQLTILGARPSDSGSYVCDAVGDRMVTTVEVAGEPAGGIVHEAKMPVEVLEGESVTLVARLTQEQAPVQWLKNKRVLRSGARLLLGTQGPSHSLTIKQTELGDSGTFSCDTGDDEVHFTLRVIGEPELQVKFVRGLSDVQAHVGETVLLWCELCKARGQVVWLKDGQELEPSGRWEIKAEGRERSLALSNVGPEDAGEYSCESKDDRTLATVTVQGESRGHGALLQGLDPPGAQPSAPGNGLCHALTVQQCQLGDAGTVTARAEGLVSTARLSVQGEGPGVLFVRKLQDVVAEELQDALLEVELSREAGEVQWLKQGVLLQPGSKYQFQEAGRRRGLTIRSLSPSDRGTYRCESLHDRTQANRPIPAPWHRSLSPAARKVSVRKPLSDVETFEKETATFQLELSHADVPGVWTRDGIRVKPSRTCRVSATGCVHSLTLLGLTLEDSGTVTFTSDTLRSSARLTIRALPIRIIKPLRDKTALARHKATLECTVSQARGRVRWFRGDTEIFASDKYEICNLDCYRTLIIHGVGPEDEASYTCDAFDDRSTARLLVEGEAEGMLGTGPGGGGGGTVHGAGTTGRCMGQAGHGLQVLRGLQNVVVVAPAEARLEYEVSAPLNGVVLGAGTRVGGERGPGAQAGAVPDLTQHEWGAAGLRRQCLRQGPAPRARYVCPAWGPSLPWGPSMPRPGSITATGPPCPRPGSVSATGPLPTQRGSVAPPGHGWRGGSGWGLGWDPAPLGGCQVLPDLSFSPAGH